jgi:hypothetical protein
LCRDALSRIGGGALCTGTPSRRFDRFGLTGNLDATFELGRAVTLSVGCSGVIGANARDHAARATLGLRF